LWRKGEILQPELPQRSERDRHLDEVVRAYLRGIGAAETPHRQELRARSSGRARESSEFHFFPEQV
jgi:hypothetical protein